MPRLVLSVIIATRHRKQQLNRCLESLCGQDYPPGKWEVIIVHDGEDQESENCAASYLGRLPLRSFVQPQAGPGIARNTGAAEALGEYLIFTDDDCLFPRDWLLRYDASFHAHAGCLIAGAAVNWLASNPYSQTTETITDRLMHHLNASTGEAQLAVGNNLGVPAEGFAKLQGYWRMFAEDRDFSARWLEDGRRIVYDPSIIVFHAHDLNLRSFLRQHFRHGHGALLFYRSQAKRGRPALQRPGFYVSLLLHVPSTQVWLLILLSQAAHTLGFICGFLNIGRRIRS
jgi:glycosyltransferase involved in cell wall biosynthesis